MRRRSGAATRSGSANRPTPRENHFIRHGVWLSISAHVRPQRVIWLICVPLTAVGGYATHVAAQMVPVHAHNASHHSARYIELSHLPLCLTVCAAVGLVALALMSARGPAVRSPLWLFALVPPVGFIAQEQAVSLFADGRPAVGLSLLVGLSLQIPFALAAYVAARAVLGLAAAVVRSLRARPAVIVRAPAFLLEPLAASWPQPPAFVLGHGQRAPPAFS